MTPQDRGFLVLAVIASLFALAIIFDPFDTVSFGGRRQTAGLIFGPAAIAYAIWGVRRSSFPEMTDAHLPEHPLRFWLCFLLFVALGIGITFLGVLALLES